MRRKSKPSMIGMSKLPRPIDVSCGQGIGCHDRHHVMHRIAQGIRLDPKRLAKKRGCGMGRVFGLGFRGG